MIPKYRAWNKKTQSFINYGDLVLDLRSGKTYAGDIGLVESAIDVTDQIELMQSIGLKDKNGVEIFEGDILKDMFRTINGNDRERFLEVFRGQTGAWRAKNQNGTLSNVFDLKKAAEVVGNIYENPELLKVH